MSVHISSQVWRLRLPPVHKLVLLHLADCADHEGRNAYPTVARMAADTGVATRTVQYALRRLEEAGLIEVTRPATRTTATVYRVRADRGARRAPPASGVHDVRPGGAPAAPVGCTSLQFGGARRAPDPSEEPSEETVSSSSSPSAIAAGQQQVIPGMVEEPKTRSVRQQITPDYRAAMRAAYPDLDEAAEYEAAVNHTAYLKAINKRIYYRRWLDNARRYKAEGARNGNRRQPTPIRADDAAGDPILAALAARDRGR